MGGEGDRGRRWLNMFVPARNFAVYQGIRYSVLSGDADSLEVGDVETEEPLGTVLIQDLAEWYTLVPTVTFLGHEFQLWRDDGRTCSLTFIGGDGKWAARTWAEADKFPDVVFSRLDMFTFNADVPREMVEERREERRDSLGLWWRQRQDDERRGQYPRSGVLVEFDGITFHDATPAADDKVFLVHPGAESPGDPRFSRSEGCWEAEIPLAECTAACSVKSLATYSGYECQVTSIVEGMATLYYLGHNGGEAEAAGFDQIDRGTWAKLVPAWELRRYREEWQDLLLDVWRRREFARPEETGDQ
ncbi:hypothetical protein SAMN05421504_11559 [Amycolatopsis xylanica]|uniref:Uncharacterized protein n=1 Tax=Amycolatopsis xylanica TaxID=589385 RepID=A0A1H3SSC6_9PSEU|nr:hypothetical protein [Amycolatopsis xylanica]SDZ40630.1 hypothetical protein SAMN05421504_11559 [Amycolatopsis xylanica]